MGLLIAILNNLSKFLVKLLSKKIKDQIFMKIFINFDVGFWFDVEYKWSNRDEIHYEIITENQLSYEDELKIFELVSKVQDKYPMIDIQIMLWAEENYKEKI